MLKLGVSSSAAIARGTHINTEVSSQETCIFKHLTGSFLHTAQLSAPTHRHKPIDKFLVLCQYGRWLFHRGMLDLINALFHLARKLRTRRVSIAEGKPV